LQNPGLEIRNTGAKIVNLTGGPAGAAVAAEAAVAALAVVAAAVVAPLAVVVRWQWLPPL